MAPKAGIRLELDRVRTLRIGWRALELLESEHGMALEDLAAQLQDKAQRMRAIRTIVWLGLLHEDPHLTMDAVGDLLEHGSPVDIIEAATSVMTERFGDGEPEGNGSAPAPRRRAGAAKKKAPRKKKASKGSG